MQTVMRLRARSVVVLGLSALLGLLTYLFLQSWEGHHSLAGGLGGALSSVLGGLGYRHSHQSLGRHKSSFPQRSRLHPPGAGGQAEESDFRIIQPFNFPQPAFSRPAPVLLRSSWVRELQDYLRPLPRGSEISVVTSTVEHTEVLLNWLVAALVKIKEPLRNVLVISMDSTLHHTLTGRGISSLFVHKNMVVSPKAAVPRVFSQVHVVRLAVVRLINHYGYHVINYDCDAIPLRNPQPIFDSYPNMDLIGTFGKGPNVLYEKWGVALNTGVMVMRATQNMGELEGGREGGRGGREGGREGLIAAT